MSDIKARIFVDDDWKARVEREREEARLKRNQTQPQTPSTPAPNSAASPKATQSGAVAPAPPPELPVDEELQDPAFEALVSTLATQAMYCLGFLGAPGQTQTVVNLEQAKDAVEMIIMLRDKTRGNLTSEENALLMETVTEVQRLFAARVQQAQAQAMQQAGVDPSNLRGEPR